MWRKGYCGTLLVGMQTGVTTVESSMEFPPKIKKEWLSVLAIPLLGICYKNLKTLIRKNICTTVFIAALFTITKVWKQPNFPSAYEWIKKICSTLIQWNYT